MAGGVRSAHDAWGAGLVPLFAENGRLRPDALPVEEFVIAGPGVDLGIANAAAEAAGTPILMFLPGRGVVHPATGAGELLGSPDAVGHLVNPLTAVRFQPEAASFDSI